jgi:hypothetical protein
MALNIGQENRSAAAESRLSAENDASLTTSSAEFAGVPRRSGRNVGTVNRFQPGIEQGRGEQAGTIKELIGIISSLMQMLAQLIGNRQEVPVKDAPVDEIPLQEPVAPGTPGPVTGKPSDHVATPDAGDKAAPADSIDQPNATEVGCDAAEKPAEVAPTEIVADDCADADFVENEKPSLDKLFNKILRPDVDGNVSEGQILHGTVVSLLRQEEGNPAKQYRAQYRKLRKHGLSPEQAVHGALTNLVRADVIKPEKARELLGVAQRAAQMDDRLTKVSNTASVSPSEAAEVVTENLRAILAGEIDAPSVKLQRKYAKVTETDAGKQSVGEAAFSNGFLWKPESDSTGNLVVLLPSNLRGQVASLEIHRSLPATSESLIERGSFAGDNHNGNRPHFRFRQPGSQYSDGSYVVVRMSDGTVSTQQIDNTGSRFEK